MNGEIKMPEWESLVFWGFFYRLLLGCKSILKLFCLGSLRFVFFHLHDWAVLNKYCTKLSKQWQPGWRCEQKMCHQRVWQSCFCVAQTSGAYFQSQRKNVFLQGLFLNSMLCSPMGHQFLGSVKKNSQTNQKGDSIHCNYNLEHLVLIVKTKTLQHVYSQA